VESVLCRVARQDGVIAMAVLSMDVSCPLTRTSTTAADVEILVHSTTFRIEDVREVLAETVSALLPSTTVTETNSAMDVNASFPLFFISHLECNTTL
jgi:hypothetical protein